MGIDYNGIFPLNNTATLPWYNWNSYFLSCFNNLYTRYDNSEVLNKIDDNIKLFKSKKYLTLK